MKKRVVMLGLGAFAFAMGQPLGPVVEAHPNHPHCYELMERVDLPEWYVSHHPCGHQGN